MRRVAAVGLVGVVLIMAAFPGTVRACSCGPRATPAEALRGADAVFRGRVASVERIRIVQGYERIVATLVVDEVWKGEVGRETVVYTGSGGGDCGFGFVVGQEYLVYAGAFADPANEIAYGLGTGICSRTTTADRAVEDFAALGPGQPPSANPRPVLPSGARSWPQCASQTEKYIDEQFFYYWKEHGGLAINGYPLTEARTETLEDGQRYYVQWFERTRLEYREVNGRRTPITLGQFGRFLHPADPPVPQLPGARYFLETGHNVTRPEFAAYWAANGDLAQFGYPLSEELTETLEDGQQYAVQYFERARFEWHPAAPDGYKVQLGQFGRRILAERSTPDPSFAPTPGQRVLRGHGDCVTSVAFGADGGTVASAGYDATIRLWDVGTGETIRTLAGHRDKITALALSPDGRFLASIGKDCSLRIWNPTTGALLHTLYPQSCRIESIAFSPNGSILASGGANSVIFWNPASGQQIRQLAGEPNYVSSLVFSPDGRTLAGGEYLGQIILWDVASGEPRALPWRQAIPRRVVFTPDGRYLLSNSWSAPGLTVWDLDSGQEMRTLRDDRCGAYALAMTPGGVLISGSYRAICTWDLASGTVREVYRGHGNSVQSVAVSPDGSWLVSGGFDTTVRLWPLAP